MTRAVVFDLYETLVDYDEATSRAFSDSLAELLGQPQDEFARSWRKGRPLRETGPLAAYLETLGLDADQTTAVTQRRQAWSRELLAHPRAGAVETLRELRTRGLATGLITVCSDDVPAVWSETPFAELFDAAVFSCSVGLRKPDPRIYLLACEQLGVQPQDAVFVGDGANDELAGAERVGMRAILIHRAEHDPTWHEVAEWRGSRITRLPQLLELL
jgi:putative hydrolase of the HAD superfamily